MAVAFATPDSGLAPTVVPLGSFPTPSPSTAWAHERFASDVGPGRILARFGVGGTIGAPGASALETHPLSPSVRMHLGVGLIEAASA
ncbi:hypothetical protein [Kitasatospora phosalacinea]|uniref:hypothetical protein n=1 Tax=Kitasatospora phosalacinea TaxID=2065 RepID=UPI0005261559|nr:hypothetical protein [Kitasatospora phosalacinea]